MPATKNVSLDLRRIAGAPQVASSQGRARHSGAEKHALDEAKLNQVIAAMLVNQASRAGSRRRPKFGCSRRCNKAGQHRQEAIHALHNQKSHDPSAHMIDNAAG